MNGALTGCCATLCGGGLPPHPQIRSSAIAIYHASTKPLSRTSGRSSVAAAAYRSASLLRDDRTGEVHDYRRRTGVVSTAVVLPGNLSCDRQPLWSAAERAERRKDARTAREWEIALPAELPRNSRETLTLAFACWLAERYEVAVDVAIHAPSRRGDDRNHHAHLMCSTRKVTLRDDGSPVLGEKSVAEFDNRQRAAAGLPTSHDDIREVREGWASLCNRWLEEAGERIRVDHRSLAAQGVDREPGVKLGVAATAILRRGGGSARGRVAENVRTRNAERAALEEELAVRRSTSEPNNLVPAPVPAPVHRDRMRTSSEQDRSSSRPRAPAAEVFRSRPRRVHDWIEEARAILAEHERWCLAAERLQLLARRLRQIALAQVTSDRLREMFSRMLEALIAGLIRLLERVLALVMRIPTVADQADAGTDTPAHKSDSQSRPMTLFERLCQQAADGIKRQPHEAPDDPAREEDPQEPAQGKDSETTDSEQDDDEQWLTPGM